MYNFLLEMWHKHTVDIYCSLAKSKIILEQCSVCLPLKNQWVLLLCPQSHATLLMFHLDLNLVSDAHLQQMLFGLGQVKGETRGTGERCRVVGGGGVSSNGLKGKFSASKSSPNMMFFA